MALLQFEEDIRGNYDVGTPSEFIQSIQTESIKALNVNVTENNHNHTELEDEVEVLQTAVKKISDSVDLLSEQHQQILKSLCELRKLVQDQSQTFRDHFEETEQLVKFVQTQLCMDERHLNLSIRKGYCVPFQKSHIGLQREVPNPAYKYM